MRLFGFDFSDASEFRFVLGARERGADCDNLPFTVAVHVSIRNPYFAVFFFNLKILHLYSFIIYMTG